MFSDLIDNLEIDEILLPLLVSVAAEHPGKDNSGAFFRNFNWDNPIVESVAASIQPVGGYIREQWAQDQGVISHKLYLGQTPGIIPGRALRIVGFADGADFVDDGRWFMIGSPSRNIGEISVLWEADLIEQIEGDNKDDADRT